MKITYLGHAGFLAETASEIVMMDPWLSSDGAFDHAWFQFPCNHHLFDPVIKLVKNSDKKVYVYISHEHQDHFDRFFLHQIAPYQFTILIPKFRRKRLYHHVRKLGYDRIHIVDDGEKILLDEGYLQFFVDDNELNSDSAVLLHNAGFSFLNLNDCKIFDRLPRIQSENGHINLFTCQYSGAVWHPICYDYDPPEYRRISKVKMADKFRAIANAISMLRPDWYVPSAGPPCFLDSDLRHLNFEEISIFARQNKIINYVCDHVRDVKVADLHPGDVFCDRISDFSYRAQDRVTEENFRRYIDEYAARYAERIWRLRSAKSLAPCLDILNRLAGELRQKLDRFYVRGDYDIHLIFGLFELSNRFISLDLRKNTVKFANQLPESNYFVLMAPSWQVERVLDRHLTWEEFCLTFRVRLSRDPDKYDTLLQGFFYAEVEDVQPLCDRILEIRNRKGRTTIEVGGCSYEIDEHCPHQGGNLRYGWVEDNRYWVCPRHRWKFDLANDGKCLSSNDSIHAKHAKSLSKKSQKQSD